MKLIYQYMMAFLVVVVTCLSVISVAIYRYSENMAYQQTWEQLEGYSDNLQKMALKSNPQTGQMNNITFGTFNDLQQVLADQKVTFMMFDNQGQESYPVPQRSNNHKPLLEKKLWRSLKAGNVIRERNSGEDQQFHLFKKHPMTYIIKPWFDDNNNLVAVLYVGSEVSTIRTNMNTMRRNLLLAFFVSTVIAIIMSWFLANWQVRRIERLQQATRQVANGNFAVQIHQEGNDELDDLAADFNEMTQSLQASQVEIERQEQRRKEFMANASHEMRTPLTTINGLLEGLAYDAIPEKSRQHSIELMRNETKRLIRLVNDNLDYEKIRTNQISLYQRNFNAYKPLTDVVTQLQQKAQDAGDQLSLKAPEELPIYADYDRFIQIIVNITQNAIQFTNQGQITITGERNAQQTATIIAIKDNGIGMTAEQVQNIWERYYKADPSRKSTKYGESGLGLAIVHQLMEQHHDQITVTSKLHEGTTFTLTFFDKAVLTKKTTNHQS